MSLSSHDGVCDETKSLAEAPAGRATTWGKARVRWKRETTGDGGRDGWTEWLAVAAGCARSHPRERGQHPVAVAGAELDRDSIEICGSLLRVPPTTSSTPRRLPVGHYICSIKLPLKMT